MASQSRQEQPGGRPPAPDPLALVQDFVNTLDIEGRSDQLTDPARLQAWLAGRGLLGAGAPVGAADLERALAVRAGLRELAMANAGLAADEVGVRRLNRALGPALLRARLDPGAGWHLDPAAGGADGALARLAAVVVGAMTDGTWSRLKPCQNHGCRWLFYDHSTNRSGTWCAMAICGNRDKARTYRRVHRS